MDVLFQALFEHDKLAASDEEASGTESADREGARLKRRALDDAGPDGLSAAKRPKKVRKAKPVDKAAYTSNKPPDFVLKLYAMFQETPDLIRWDQGRIVIPQPALKLQAVLPNYFRHGKFTSFQRQLNNFGFHKRISESTSKSRIYARHDMIGYPAEALLDLRRKPGSPFATWEPTEETRAAYAMLVAPPEAPPPPAASASPSVGEPSTASLVAPGTMAEKPTCSPNSSSTNLDTLSALSAGLSAAPVGQRPKAVKPVSPDEEAANVVSKADDSPTLDHTATTPDDASDVSC